MSFSSNIFLLLGKWIPHNLLYWSLSWELCKLVDTHRLNLSVEFSWMNIHPTHFSISYFLRFLLNLLNLGPSKVVCFLYPPWSSDDKHSYRCSLWMCSQCKDQSQIFSLGSISCIPCVALAHQLHQHLIIFHLHIQTQYWGRVPSLQSNDVQVKVFR